MQKNILLVDYCPETIETFQELFRQKTFDLTVAGNEEIAKKLLRMKTFHLLVTETLLPKSHGYLLAQYVAENYPNMKIIIISAQLKEADVKEEAIEKYGADDFFEKPLDTLKLRTRIYKLLEINEWTLNSPDESDGMATNIHILPTLEELAAEKKLAESQAESKDTFGKIIDDVDRDAAYEIELD